MIVLGAGLMPAVPEGPCQDVVDGLLNGQDHVPEEAANLLDAQRAARPRPALNAAKLLPVCGGGGLLLNASTAIAPARRMVRSA